MFDVGEGERVSRLETSSLCRRVDIPSQYKCILLENRCACILSVLDRNETQVKFPYRTTCGSVLHPM